MNYLKYTQYVYLVVAIFFTYKSISIWNEATDEHFLFLGIALVSVFLFFLRRKFAKKFEIPRAMLGGVTNEIFHKFFGEVHVAGQIAEGDFGFDHPKLRSVAGGVGIFCTESGPKSIDVGKRRGENFGLELSGNGQEGFFAKKILPMVNFALLIFRWLGEVEGGDAKHIPRTLGVTGGNNGRVDVAKLFGLKELVHGIG